MRRADHSSRGILPSVVCLKCDREASIVREPRPTWAVEPLEEEEVDQKVSQGTVDRRRDQRC